jgi:hypothetical protein
LLPDPKTAGSARPISLPQFLVAMLRGRASALQPGGNSPHSFVFAGPKGGPMRHNLFYRRKFKPARPRGSAARGARAPLPRPSPYLRRTAHRARRSSEADPGPPRARLHYDDPGRVQRRRPNAWTRPSPRPAPSSRRQPSIERRPDRATRRDPDYIEARRVQEIAFARAETIEAANRADELYGNLTEAEIDNLPADLARLARKVQQEGMTVEEAVTDIEIEDDIERRL